MGCTFGQGFYFAKPVPRDELVVLLKRQYRW
jgi:EAL domain-containing protein (putative c-di-GMP-specific phosphodiesterase class I)